MKRFFLFLILISSLFGCFYAYQGIYRAKTPGSNLITAFLVTKGEGVKEISINLKNQNLIKSALLFQGYVFARGESGKLKAGRYELSPAMNIPQIAAKLVSGEAIKETITIIEGWDLRDIEKELSSKLIPISAGQNSKPQFKIQNLKVADYKSEFTFLDDVPEKADLEGFLFPDTYEFSYGATTGEVVKKMLQNFNRKITPELKKEIKKQRKTIFEIITMASLIEKEVKTKKDKRIVSGILWKRLEYGIPLQVDATISYIREKQNITLPEGAENSSYVAGKKKARISKKDLKIDSPYNTYKYRGLPLGPICNPGLESIIAAVYPENSQYWYYLSGPDGTTHFSKNLKEHNVNKAKYLTLPLKNKTR